ncbi:MAG: aminotransferase class V-fold PLP-dependent enzyme [Acidobacteria bacterium]|nr:aminotransferase class V-fold PLP-dependent enzyme [Acidobacteriota bacterium]
MPVYLDCAATTPLDPRVREEMLRHLGDEAGNAGSRTHEYGRRARTAVERARDEVAAVVATSRGDVIFTSGATESNNLAILGLVRYGEATGRRHVVSTAIEHHAVLEPLAELERRGFHLERLRPDAGGAVDAHAVRRAVRHDTLLVSVMHVNNETGVIQPVEEIASLLSSTDAFFHVDAAQGFGKQIAALRHPRVDLISVSGHKLHAPQGVGALVARRRGRARPPLEPLMFGGGQERGWRPGTLPVHLIAALGTAARLALEEHDERERRCLDLRVRLLQGLAPLCPVFNGDPNRSVAHIVNVSIPGVEAEAAIEAWGDLVAIAHGAACTSQTYTCSHVLTAMGVSPSAEEGALRLSWSHVTPLPDLAAMVHAIDEVRATRGSSG